MLDLHPLIANRWSPRAFDPTAELSPGELAAVLDAARWAPSAGNSQPWRFVVGHRGDETYQRILAQVDGGSRRWAARASALLVAAHLHTADGGDPLPYAAYDLGQAVAHLTLQAGSLGLHVRQIVAFDATVLGTELELPAELAPAVVIALGRLGDPETLPPDLRNQELSLRTRHRLAQLVLPRF